MPNQSAQTTTGLRPFVSDLNRSAKEFMPTISLKSVSLLEVEALIHLAKVRLQKHKAEKKGAAEVIEYQNGKDAVDLALESLDKSKLTEIIALMWLGRGASGEKASDWLGLLKSAEGNTPDYPSEKYPLADYLESGLHKLGYTEAERLVFE